MGTSGAAGKEACIGTRGSQAGVLALNQAVERQTEQGFGRQILKREVSNGQEAMIMTCVMLMLLDLRSRYRNHPKAAKM